MRRAGTQVAADAAAMNRMLLGYNPDLDIFDGDLATRDTPRAAGHGRAEVAASDAESTELAAELLDATAPPLFAAKLGQLVQRAAHASGRPLSNAVATELVAQLHPVARHTFASLQPRARGAAGAASNAGRVYGIELEGLSSEDQEFESARRFAQLTRAAARLAALAPSGVPPGAIARLAARTAAHRYAPGWLQPRLPPPADLPAFRLHRCGQCRRCAAARSDPS